MDDYFDESDSIENNESDIDDSYNNDAIGRNPEDQQEQDSSWGNNRIDALRNMEKKAGGKSGLGGSTAKDAESAADTAKSVAKIASGNKLEIAKEAPKLLKKAPKLLGMVTKSKLALPLIIVVLVVLVILVVIYASNSTAIMSYFSNYKEAYDSNDVMMSAVSATNTPYLLKTHQFTDYMIEQFAEVGLYYGTAEGEGVLISSIQCGSGEILIVVADESSPRPSSAVYEAGENIGETVEGTPKTIQEASAYDPFYVCYREGSATYSTGTATNYSSIGDTYYEATNNSRNSMDSAKAETAKRNGVEFSTFGDILRDNNGEVILDTPESVDLAYTMSFGGNSNETEATVNNTSFHDGMCTEKCTEEDYDNDKNDEAFEVMWYWGLSEFDSTTERIMWERCNQGGLEEKIKNETYMSLTDEIQECYEHMYDLLYEDDSLKKDTDVGTAQKNLSERARKAIASYNKYNINNAIKDVEEDDPYGCAGAKGANAISNVLSSVDYINNMNYTMRAAEISDRTMAGADAGAYHILGNEWYTKGTLAGYNENGEKVEIAENVSFFDTDAFKYLFRTDKYLDPNSPEVQAHSQNYSSDMYVRGDKVDSEKLRLESWGDYESELAKGTDAERTYTACVSSDTEDNDEKKNRVSEAAKDFFSALSKPSFKSDSNLFFVNDVNEGVSGTASALSQYASDLVNNDYTTNRGNPNLSYAVKQADILGHLAFNFSGKAGTAEEVAYQEQKRDEVIADNARLAKLTHSPFDINNKYTFLGSIANSMTPIATTIGSSSIISTLSDVSNVVGSAITSLTPFVGKASADTLYTTNVEADCTRLKYQGVVGNEFCQQIAVGAYDILESMTFDQIIEEVKNHKVDGNDIDNFTIGEPEEVAQGKVLFIGDSRTLDIFTADDSQPILGDTHNGIDVYAGNGMGIEWAKSIVNAGEYDVIISWMGANDAAQGNYFNSSYQDYFQNLISAGKKVILITAGPVDESHLASVDVGKYTNDNIDKFNSALKSWATSNNVDVVDFHSNFSSLGYSISEADGIHYVAQPTTGYWNYFLDEYSRITGNEVSDSDSQSVSKSFVYNGETYTINDRSDLANWIVACPQRGSQLSVTDAAVKSYIDGENEVANSTSGGWLRKLLNVLTGKKNKSAEEVFSTEYSRKFTNGQACSDPEYDLYSAFSIIMTYMESTQQIEESAVASFIKDYRGNNPINTYEDAIAYYSGMDDESVELALGMIEYENYLAHYNPTGYGPSEQSPVEDYQYESDSLIAEFVRITNNATSAVAVMMKNILYEDVRNRVRLV